MRKKKKQHLISSIALSIAAAGSISGLIILATWRFEFRSFVKLLLQAAPIAVPLSIIFYFGIFRRVDYLKQFSPWLWLSEGFAAYIISSQIVPAQINFDRYVTTIALVSSLLLIFLSCVISFLFFSRNFPWKTIFIIIILLSGLIGIGLVIQSIWYSRMYSDDFCYATDFDELGFPAAGLWFYNDWSGRFFSNFLVMGFADQPRTIIFLIILTLLSFLFSIYYLSHKDSKLDRLFLSLSASLLALLTITIVAPDFFKSYFWISSALVLFPLFILIPLFITGIMRISRRSDYHIGWLILAFILSFCIATIHEVATLGWMTLLAGWVFWLWVEKSENSVLKRFLIVGFLAAGLGLIVMFISPGIDNRAAVQRYPGTTPIMETLQIAVRNLFEFFRIIPSPYYAHEADWQPGWLLLAGMLGIGWVVDFPIQRNWKAAGFVVLLTGAMVYVSLVPAAYVYRGNIPLRSQMIPSFYLTMGAFMLGTALPIIKSQPITNSILFSIMVAVVLAMRIVVPQMLRPMDALKQYAADWDARDVKFQTSIGIPPDIYVPWDEYEQNMDCVQRYYEHLSQVNEIQE